MEDLRKQSTVLRLFRREHVVDEMKKVEHLSCVSDGKSRDKFHYVEE